MVCHFCSSKMWSAIFVLLNVVCHFCISKMWSAIFVSLKCGLPFLFFPNYQSYQSYQEFCRFKYIYFLFMFNQKLSKHSINIVISGMYFLYKEIIIRIQKDIKDNKIPSFSIVRFFRTYNSRNTSFFLKRTVQY